MPNVAAILFETRKAAPNVGSNMIPPGYVMV